MKKNSFADGKIIRDIFWPAGTFIISVERHEVTHGHGAHSLGEGDTLCVRYSTYDETQTMEELESIVGEQ